MKDRPLTMSYTQPPHEKEGLLTREEVQCPICWSILIRPVTLPCAHSLCLTCFERTVEDAYFQCPCCRARTSVWSRRATKSDTLINEEYWQKIQEQFPRLVEARENGEDSQLIDEHQLDKFEQSSTFDFGQKDDTSDFTRSSDTPRNEHCASEPDSTSVDVACAKTLTGNPEVDETANCIRQFKAEDGFGTQRFCEELNVCNEPVENEEPMIEETYSLNSIDNNPKLCRNLFSEWAAPDTAVNCGSSGESISTAILSRKRNNPCSSSSHQEVSSSTSGKLSKISEVSEESSDQSFGESRVNSLVTPEMHNPKSLFVPVVSPQKTESTSIARGKGNASSKVATNCGKRSKISAVKRSQLSSSCNTPDSINVEVNSHFRPIRSAPKTPPKRLPDGSYLPEPRIVKSTPIRLNSSPMPAMMVLASLSEQRDKASDPVSKPASFDSKSDSKSLRNRNREMDTSSPPLPSLVHFASQGILSPKQKNCFGGRHTAPPPDLDDYGEENDRRYMLGRQLSDIKYRQAQAAKLEEFRLKKLQEEKDQALAKKIQRELNSRNKSVIRTRGSNERYSIRNWTSSDTAKNSVANSSLSSVASNVTYSLRTRRSNTIDDRVPSVTCTSRKTRSTQINTSKLKRKVSTRRKENTQTSERVLRSRR